MLGREKEKPKLHFLLSTFCAVRSCYGTVCVLCCGLCFPEEKYVHTREVGQVEDVINHVIGFSSLQLNTESERYSTLPQPKGLRVTKKQSIKY